jgi:cytochrome c oxidase subunit 1
VAPGTIFALFAGIYYWFPKFTGRKMSDRLGRIHFWGSLLFINGVFFPMFIQGLAGVSRRLYDGGAQYAHAQPVLKLNAYMSISAFGLLLFQVPFIINFFKSMKWGEKVDSNPWQATTLEWAATTSPPLGHGNFDVLPVVVRGPYDYFVPGSPHDYLPQHVADDGTPVATPPPAGIHGGGALVHGAAAQKEL